MASGVVEQTARSERHDRVADHMQLRIATARDTDRVQDVLDRIEQSDLAWDTLTYTFVIDHEGRPVGALSIEMLNNEEPQMPVTRVMRDVPVLHEDDDQEEAVRLAIRHRLDAVPVVDPDDRILGVIDHQAIFKVLQEENAEDRLLGSGIVAHAGEALTGGPVRLAWRRLPWLLVGLAGGMLAAEVVGGFEETLARRLELAFFIPVVVYMADAVATQTETIYIRGMSVVDMSLGRYVLREALTASMLAAACAAGIVVFARFRFSAPATALIVGASMFLSVITAAFIAVLIPWALERTGADPALGAGPFATIVQDIVTILIYFTVATMVLA